AVKAAEDVKKEKKRIEECLVAFAAVEKDDTDSDAVAAQAAKEILNVCNQVKTKKVVIYPFVHLTSSPSPLDIALSTLKKTEAILASDPTYSVTRAPFGWYKSFDIRCKGHPLSELSRQFGAGGAAPKGGKDAAQAADIGIRDISAATSAAKEVVSESLKADDSVKREYFILTPDGKLAPVAQFDFSKHPLLQKFANYETNKVRAYDREPPHIALMREHAIASHEPASDSGNLRWYPNGRLMKKLLERRIMDVCIGYGAMEVETPIMYDFEHPCLKKYLNRFPARQYVVKSDEKEYFLRFAACFGQFLIASDLVISHKNLPIKLFELTKYSFRREQSGEVAGLRRLRVFTMPDMHTFAKDADGARTAFSEQFGLCIDWMNMLGPSYEAAFRIQRDWYNENKEWYANLVKRFGQPVLVEMFSERYAYFITKFEFNVIDCLDKASALSTVQIDVENAETFNIAYVDEKGQKQRPYLLHTSISGSTDRNIYALLEWEAMQKAAGKVPMFPIWLSPTQVRIVPVSDAQLPHCEKILHQLKSMNIRADLDDRGETLQKKVRDAEQHWVPFIAVIGDKEIASGKLAVRIRATGKQELLSAEELGRRISEECKGMPFEPLSLADHLTKRPVI
ncbi:MAG: threonine--tRNA ligase, partial [Candidatus Aenigmatarchaeota archaeon]